MFGTWVEVTTEVVNHELPLRLQYFEYLDEVQNQYTTPLEIELAPGYVVSVP
eukprot:COSAG01_NODE_16163_length_1263_cov_4.553265_3_plen_51_part_01